MTDAGIPLRVRRRIWKQTERAWWHDLAECRGMDAELFFPSKGEVPSEARAACGRCPVRGACLAHALSVPEKFGVWGGTTERQRRRLRRAA